MPVLSEADRIALDEALQVLVRMPPWDRWARCCRCQLLVAEMSWLLAAGADDHHDSGKEGGGHGGDGDMEAHRGHHDPDDRDGNRQRPDGLRDRNEKDRPNPARWASACRWSEQCLAQRQLGVGEDVDRQPDGAPHSQGCGPRRDPGVGRRRPVTEVTGCPCCRPLQGLVVRPPAWGPGPRRSLPGGPGHR